ncbi:MAG: cation diffusion facilitator family transporter [Eubacteriales bacterium]|nr:cation diffusion facilitator family transporter [Eubacteriales bacterium]
MQNQQRSQIINRVSAVTITVNIFLSAIKLLAGFFAHSQAMVSDGVESLSDVFMTLILLAGVNMAKKSKDDNHPYGHEKLESIASIILSVALVVTAISIAAKGFSTIISIMAGKDHPAPKAAALAAAMISICAKEGLFRYAKSAAEKTKSTALMADAWNFRSDAIASIGSLVGIGGAMLGASVLDPIVSILIAGLIVRVAVKIGITAINEVTDHAADLETQEILYDTIGEVDGVWRVDELKTRLHGNSLLVDVSIAVNGDISVKKAHDIAENVSQAVYSCQVGVKECMVHVNPYRERDTT